MGSAEPNAAWSRAAPDEDLRVARLVGALLVRGELLEELLARADAGELRSRCPRPAQARQRMRSRARSTIFTGSPMSSTKISPPCPWRRPAARAAQASGMVMKYRFISGCVTVTGPALRDLLLKIGTTEPLEPSTLPKRTVTKRVLLRCESAWM
jgi:hypothetical protein